MGTLRGAYTDPRFQSAVPFGSRSHWLPMWRSYLETVPACQVLDGVGLNWSAPVAHPAVLAEHLARAGVRRARFSMNWNVLDFDAEQVAAAIDQGATGQSVRACARAGVRPLLILDANSGGPCPSRGLTLVLSAPLAPGDRSAQLASTAGIVPGYTGLSFLPPQRCMAGHLITGVSGSRVALSQPYGSSGSPTLPAGRSLAAHTLRYRPFDAAGSAGYAATSAGWQLYTRRVAQWAAGALGRAGRPDLGFDLELWNELSFGSEFLWLGRYYSPSPYSDPAPGWQPGSIMQRLTQETAALWGAYPDEFAGVELVQGFSNTIPWVASLDAPAAVGGISRHCYEDSLSFGPAVSRPAATPINALFAPDTSGFEPQYDARLPEFWLLSLATETAVRDLSPLTDPGFGNAHGRYTRRPAGPACWGWVTEMGCDPAGLARVWGVPALADVQTALYWKAKYYLRAWLAHLGKGARGVYQWATDAGGDDSGQLPLQSLLDYARTHDAYPSDDAPYTSPAHAALRRALQRIGAYADPLPPAGWGTAAGVGTRQITVDAIADGHDHYQWGGDGTAAHPPLHDRECLFVQPIQVNARRLVLVYYVMTSDMTRRYDPAQSGGRQFDLPEATFTLTLGGLAARAAQIAVYDPLADRDVPITVRSAQDGRLVLDVAASDRPYLLTIQERTSGAVAASSYLQNARLTWMLGVAYPSAPALQYVGLFSAAPTNTTAGTELSAGNYQRVAVGLANAAAPTVVATGATGSSTYSYQVIKKNAAGATIGSTISSGSGVATITNGNSSLTSSNYNAISWPADAGAASYDVLKWGGSAWTLLGNTSSTSLSDTGQAATSYTVPTQNTTGWTTVQAGSTETISNALPLTWPVANVSWGTVVAMALFDAPTGGNMLDFASVTNAVTIASGSQYSFPAGMLILGEA